jgi:hypothetical protein
MACFSKQGGAEELKIPKTRLAGRSHFTIFYNYNNNVDRITG